jgi:2-polyprenyl-3-methyl-5-hydroxy-6-metoxy-1,4-benzoquinol methylase
MTLDYRQRIYARYFSTSYSVVNRPTDADYEHHARALASVLGPYLPASRDAAIVDVACGIGYAVHMLRRRGYAQAYGVDISREQVDVAEARGLAVRHADAFEHLQGQRETCDAILALDFIEHLTKDEILKFFDLARAALRPLGSLIMKTPNASSLIGPRARYRDLTHELLFTEMSLREGLMTCGLDLTHCVGESIRPFTAGGWARWAVAGLGRAMWKTYLIAELGREGFHIPTSYNLIAVARRP